MRGITIQRLSNPEKKKHFDSMKQASDYLGREKSYIKNHVMRRSPLVRSCYFNETWRIIEIDAGLREKRNDNKVNNGDVAWKIL